MNTDAMNTDKNTQSSDGEQNDFLRELIIADREAGLHSARVQTRFPPEPNGYPHLGHVKSICLNFGIAEEFGGTCNLRFDDTNPERESNEFVQSFIEALDWLGFKSDRGPLFTSDYFEQLYAWAQSLIKKGLAYVDDQTADQIRETRGDFTTPGINSPFRDRSIEENLSLFEQMRDGVFGDGEKCLRAKIDMKHPNMSMRDPLMYRIRHVTHHRTGDDWCIYPNYDWAHGQSDAIEGVTHSFCTLEFENNRELYDWFLDNLELENLKHPSSGGPKDATRSKQREFNRLSVTHTVLSKRLLATLVENGVVEGWDDAQMPTVAGLRRRGYPAKALQEFVAAVGVSKFSGTAEIELLESFVRTELNRTAQRRMVVLNPLKLTITNWPKDHVEYREVTNNPEDETAGTRMVAFSGQLWIEADDFMIDPPRKFFRLAPGREVRLRSGYFVTCTDVIEKDGEIVEVLCTYDPETKGGQAPDGRKVKATLHWVSADHSLKVDVRSYERLFTDPHPGAGGKDPIDCLNPNARKDIKAQAEDSISELTPGQVVQFERLGYYAHDLDRKGLFHQTVGLRDEWSRIQKRKTQQASKKQR